MDDATLERLAIQEICDEIKQYGTNSNSNSNSQPTSKNPLPNKRFLGRTLKAAVDHNKRQHSKEKFNSHQKFIELKKKTESTSRSSRESTYPEKTYKTKYTKYTRGESKSSSHSSRHSSRHSSYRTKDEYHSQPNRTNNFNNENSYYPHPYPIFSPQSHQYLYFQALSTVMNAIATKTQSKTKRKKKSKESRRKTKRKRIENSSDEEEIIDLTKDD